MRVESLFLLPVLATGALAQSALTSIPDSVATVSIGDNAASGTVLTTQSAESADSAGDTYNADAASSTAAAANGSDASESAVATSTTGDGIESSAATTTASASATSSLAASGSSSGSPSSNGSTNGTSGAARLVAIPAAVSLIFGPAGALLALLGLGLAAAA